MNLNEAYERVQEFKQEDLGKYVSRLERDLRGADKVALDSLYSRLSLDTTVLDSAFALKWAAAQIDTVVHAAGVLLSLPHILHEGETVESLSLGAGNTGRPFDLETSIRIAEFKFIGWRGGPETVRQVQLFKDFFFLAEYPTSKDRFLYVLGTEHPLRFLRSDRRLSGVVGGNARLRERYRELYGDRFTYVRDYYEYRKDRVELVDLAGLVPSFASG